MTRGSYALLLFKNTDEPGKRLDLKKERGNFHAPIFKAILRNVKRE